MAAGIALPLILHQAAPKSHPQRTGEQTDPLPPPAGPAPTSAGPTDPADRVDPAEASGPAAPSSPPTSPGRRALGIVLAALAIPLGLVTAAALGLADIEFALIPGLAVLLGLAIGGYLVAGVRAGSAVLIPMIILFIAAVLAIGELAAWAGLLFAEGETLQIVVGGIVITAIPVISTTLILASARRKRRPPIPEAS